MFFRIKSGFESDGDYLIPKLLFVLLVLFNGLACAENKDLKWLPYVDKDKGKTDSAALAPDGKSFYTLKDGLVTHWQLNPIKRIRSFETGLILDQKKYLSTFVSDNAKKMIIWTNKSIYLIDLNKEKVIKEVKTNTIGAQLIANEFVTLTKDSVISKYDLDSLNIILTKRIYLECKEGRCNPDYLIFRMIVGNKDYMYIGAQSNLAKINMRNLELINERWAMRIKYDSFNQDVYYITDGIECGKNHQNCRNRLNINSGEEVKLLSLKESSIEGTLPYLLVEGKSLGTRAFSPRAYNNNMDITIAGGLQVISGRGKVSFYSRNSIQDIARFYQFDNHEWILKSWKFPEFYLSTNGRKYLYMVNEDELIKQKKQRQYSPRKLPISKSIFKKYNKNITIKAQ